MIAEFICRHANCDCAVRVRRGQYDPGAAEEGRAGAGNNGVVVVGARHLPDPPQMANLANNPPNTPHTNDVIRGDEAEDTETGTNDDATYESVTDVEEAEATDEAGPVSGGCILA